MRALRNDDTRNMAAPRTHRHALHSDPEAIGCDADDQILRHARATQRRHLLRRQLLGSDALFGEPAWEMLLDLFVHECEGNQLSMTALCIAAAIPESSAMRLAQRMCDSRLLVRLADPADGRRSFMKIAPDVAHRLRAYFAEGGE